MQLESNINQATNQAVELELNLFESLCQSVLSEISRLRAAAQGIATLDVMSSLALIALERNYVRPTITLGREFRVLGGRHATVEVAQSERGTQQFVANDCLMEEESGRFILLTGPNMGGKSTFLRQNAIIAILAQIGSFVPAAAAQIGIIDAIFSRVRLGCCICGRSAMRRRPHDVPRPGGSVR